MNKSHNVLQYEFFHVGGKDAKSLDEVMAECFERTADNLPMAMAGDDTGPGIKTVGRIYDMDGRVTHWANQVKDLEAQREVHFNAPRSNPITNWYARWQIGRLNRRMDKVKKLMVDYFTTYIGLSFNGEWNVARETWNHAFRPARREEYIELRQAAIMAKNLWLFIFEPNDLLADRNQGIVHIM